MQLFFNHNNSQSQFLEFWKRAETEHLPQERLVTSRIRVRRNHWQRGRHDNQRCCFPLSLVHLPGIFELSINKLLFRVATRFLKFHSGILKIQVFPIWLLYLQIQCKFKVKVKHRDLQIIYTYLQNIIVLIYTFFSFILKSSIM